MPTQIYKVDGKRVPSVTTVIGASLGWNKGALMHWAWNEGVEGRNYRQTRDEAANIGTIAHMMVEADIRGIEFPTPKTNKEAESWEPAIVCFEAWKRWKKEVEFEAIVTEKALVSKVFNIGGCLDVATVSSAVSILDLKTSNAVYPDHLIQLAAYRALWNENYPETQVKDCYLLRLGKDGTFAYHFYPASVMELPWQAFLRLRDLYDLKKEIKP